MANQKLAKDEVLTLTIEQSISRLLFNPELSDVCFLVGEQQGKIYAHRLLLANESEMFKSMFYGELKETKYEVEVPDLSPVGFRNMIKYFYTKKVDVDLSEIHSTYMSANKYLALSFIRDLTDHINKSSLEASNICIIYDQLSKLKFYSLLNDTISDSFIRLIEFKNAAMFSEACKSDTFEQIGEDTLVSILKLKFLNIPEIELLRACLRWTDRKAMNSSTNQTSKQEIFKSIKHLIRFHDLTLIEFSSIISVFDIDHYLTNDEIASIFVHLSNRCKPIQMAYQSTRGPREVQKALSESTASSRETITEIKSYIRVNKEVCVTSIKTYSAKIFKIYRDQMPLILDAKIVRDTYGNHTTDLILVLEPDSCYEMRLSCYENPFSLSISRVMSLKSDESEVEFKIESDIGLHCIECIEFLGPFV